LFNISGGENLSMFEVEKISSHIAEQNQKAKIIFGISKNPKLKNKIKTTILMTGGQIRDEAEENPEPAMTVLSEKIDVPVKKEVVAVEKERKSPAAPKKKNPKPPKNKKEPGLTPPPEKKPDRKEKKEDKNPVSFIPVFDAQVPPIPVLEQRKIDIIEAVPELNKKTIRRSGLEIRKAEELEEKKRLAQEKEWEIPAFLRKVKFKS
jgi:hypothetical protein